MVVRDLAVVLLVLLLGYFIYMEQVKSNDRLMTSITHSNVITRQSIDDLGRQVTQASSNYLTRDDLKHSRDSVITSIRKDLAGPVRNIERITRLTYERVSNLAIPVVDTVIEVRGESVQASYFSKKTSYMDLKGFLAKDSLFLDYTLTGGWSLEYRWKPTSIFKPKELELTVRADDPAVRVNNVQQFQIVDPVPFFRKPGVAFAAGAITMGLVTMSVK